VEQGEYWSRRKTRLTPFSISLLTMWGLRIILDGLLCTLRDKELLVLFSFYLLCNIHIIGFFFFGSIGFEIGAFHLQCRHSITWAMPLTLLVLVILQIESHAFPRVSALKGAPLTSASYRAGISDMLPHAWFILWDRVSLTCLPKLASYHNPISR
jgi:hypothetical protein